MAVNSVEDIPAALRSLAVARYVALDFEFPCAEPNAVCPTATIEDVYRKYARDYDGVYPCQIGLTIALDAEEGEGPAEPGASGEGVVSRRDAVTDVHVPSATDERDVESRDSGRTCPFDRPEVVDAPSFSSLASFLPFPPGRRLEYRSFCFNVVPPGRFVCNYRTALFLQNNGFSLDEWIRTAIVFRSGGDGDALMLRIRELCEELYAAFDQSVSADLDGNPAAPAGAVEAACGSSVPSGLGGDANAANAADSCPPVAASAQADPAQPEGDPDALRAAQKDTSHITPLTTLVNNAIGLIWDPEEQRFREGFSLEDPAPELRDLATRRFNTHAKLALAAEKMREQYKEHVASLDLSEELRGALLRLVPYFTPLGEGLVDGKFVVSMSLARSRSEARAHMDAYLASLPLKICGLATLFARLRDLGIPVVFFAGLSDAFVLLNALRFNGHPPESVGAFTEVLRDQLPCFADLKLLTEFPPVANLLTSQHKPAGQTLGALFKATKLDAAGYSLFGAQQEVSREQKASASREHNAGYDSYITAALYRWMVDRLVLPCDESGASDSAEDPAEDPAGEPAGETASAKGKAKRKSKSKGKGKEKKSGGLPIQAVADAFHASTNRFYVFSSLHTLDSDPGQSLFDTIGLFARGRKAYDVVKPLREVLHSLEDQDQQAALQPGSAKRVPLRHYMSLSMAGGRLLLRRGGIVPAIVKLIRMNGLFSSLQGPGNPPSLRFSPLLKRRLEKYVDFSVGYPLTLDCAALLVGAEEDR